MTPPCSHLRRRIEQLGFLAGCLLLPCCGPTGEVAITQKRLLPEKEQQPRTGASSEERFRLALGMAGFGSPNEEAPRAQPQVQWEAPEGWKALSGNAMRLVDLRFGQNFGGECYVMRAGGSLADNVNRWRQQMGQPPIPKEEVNKLPKRPLSGKEAYLVSIDGDYTGMGDASVKKDYRLLGVILPLADVSYFIKMVGPRAEVADNEAKFLAFCDSLRIDKL